MRGALPWNCNLGVGPFSPTSSDWMREDGLRLCQGESGLIAGNISSPKELSGVGKGCRGRRWSHRAGGVQGTLGCCTEGRGLVGNAGVRWGVGLGDLRGLSQPQ